MSHWNVGLNPPMLPKSTEKSLFWPCGLQMRIKDLQINKAPIQENATTRKKQNQFSL
jgi:hypothetical protein